jgi:hypothetical protein
MVKSLVSLLNISYDLNLQFTAQMGTLVYNKKCPFYRGPETSKDVLVDAGFPYDKVTALRDRMKGTICISCTLRLYLNK